MTTPIQSAIAFLDEFRPLLNAQQWQRCQALIASLTAEDAYKGPYLAADSWIPLRDQLIAERDAAVARAEACSQTASEQHKLAGWYRDERNAADRELARLRAIIAAAKP